MKDKNEIGSDDPTNKDDSQKNAPSSEPEVSPIPNVKNGDATELHDSPVSLESDEVLAEPQEASEPSNQNTSLSLKHWGPYKRLIECYKMWPNEEDKRGFWHDHELENNERSRLPDDESVEVPAVWVIELYTPSTVDKLREGINKLGWNSRKRMHSEQSVIEWIDEKREKRRFGWMPLGLVITPDNTNFMPDRTASLPPGVRAAFPTLIHLTPSVTALVIPFQFEDDAAASLEVPLRADFKMDIRRHMRFPSRLWRAAQYILTGRLHPSPFWRETGRPPSEVRRESVSHCLQKLEDKCTKWVEENLPGTFASLPGSKFPTAALLITEKTKPMSKEARNIEAFSGLAISRNSRTWESNEWPGVRLFLEGNRLAFACLRRDAVPDKSSYDDPNSNFTITQSADRDVQGLLLRWSATCLLNGYKETMSTLRDRVARDDSYQPVKNLKELRSLIRKSFYDIGIAGQDILEFTESNLYDFKVLEMNSVGKEGEEAQGLVTSLRSTQAEDVQRVQREADLLKSMLSVSNDLTQTISNLRLQRSILLLTVISVGIALWSFFRG